MLEWLPFYYLHRLLRILPPYIFCLCLWWKIAVLMGKGPYWFRWLSFEHRCDLYWWTNLLFVNNLVPYSTAETDECLYHSWYLANDFQFYTISPVFIILFIRRRQLGWMLLMSTLAISMGLAAIYTVVLGASAHSFDGLWVTYYSREMYTKPQFRIPPYLVGLGAGYLWHEKCVRFPRYRFPDIAARVLLVGACVLLGFITFCGLSAYQKPPCDYWETPGKCGSDWSLTARVLYNTFTKPLWSIGIAIITLLSANDQVRHEFSTARCMSTQHQVLPSVNICAQTESWTP
jgi:peptidoglycan/LPS O-acetylase OafA/YrhL